ncbi:MAG: ATP-binding protein [Heliomarina sp.]|uniref:ATP-binding protein n=1 Tax=Heliomarina sp. TaxID=2917556 RepID=UPI0040597215
MQDGTGPADHRPTGVKAYFEPRSLLARYARGRVIHFAKRQILTLSAGLVVTATASPATGLIAIAIALTCEYLDFLLLRHIWRELRDNREVDHLTPWIPVTAAIQTISVSICMILLLLSTKNGAPLFAFSFLAGATINAGLTLPYHKPAAVIRLVIFGITTAAFVAALFTGRSWGDTALLLDCAGVMIMGFIVYSILRFANATFYRNRQKHLALLDHQEELVAVNAELEQSRKEAEQLTLVARNANDSVFILDADQRIIWTNDAFSKITGYSRAEAIGRRAGDLMNGPGTSAETVAAIQHANRHSLPFRGEIQNITRDGREIWLETNQVPVLDENGNLSMTLAIERDITSAREIAKQLESARDRAEDAARAKTEFLANMSHEIRTPMNGVIGMADLICESDLSEEQRVYAEAIRSSAQSLLSLLNDILDISKLDAERMILNPVDFDLHACLNDTVLPFRRLAHDKGIDLALDIAPDIPRFVFGDDSRFRQILVNLIGNALKFTESGGVTVTVARADPGFTVRVKDSGIGIAPKHLETIFERFSQAEDSTARRFGGTGLGLTISRLLARAMGGTLEVTSRLGKGSEFAVSLPFPPCEKTDVPKGHDAKRRLRTEELVGKKILVAEDNRINRVLIQKYLRDLPVKLFFAENGREAVEKCRTERPDLILMDMSMPEMSGLEATEVIRREQGAHPVIVALTANAFATDQAACLRAGMTGFLTKPVRRNDLIKAMLELTNPTVPPSGTDPAPP